MLIRTITMMVIRTMKDDDDGQKKMSSITEVDLPLLSIVIRLRLAPCASSPSLCLWQWSRWWWWWWWWWWRWWWRWWCWWWRRWWWWWGTEETYKSFPRLIARRFYNIMMDLKEEQLTVKNNSDIAIEAKQHQLRPKTAENMPWKWNITNLPMCFCSVCFA